MYEYRTHIIDFKQLGPLPDRVFRPTCGGPWTVGPGCIWESDYFLLLTGGPNSPSRHSLRKWSFFVTDGGSTDPQDPNWLEVLIFTTSSFNIPLSPSKFASYFGKKFSKIFKIFPKFSIFSQNFHFFPKFSKKFKIFRNF